MTRTDPLRGFRFLVEFDQSQQGGFTQCAGHQPRDEARVVREGGVNDFEHKLVTLTTYPDLVLERGLADESVDWHQEVVEGRVKREGSPSRLRNEAGDESGAGVQGAFPVKWTVVRPRRGQRQVVIESLEFAHHGISPLTGSAA